MKVLLGFVVLMLIGYGLASNVSSQALINEYCRKKAQALVDVTYSSSVRVVDRGSQKEIFAQCAEEEEGLSTFDALDLLMRSDFEDERS